MKRRTNKQTFAQAYNWLRGQLRYRPWARAFNIYPKMVFTEEQHLALIRLNVAHDAFHQLIERGYREVKELTFPEEIK